MKKLFSVALALGVIASIFVLRNIELFEAKQLSEGRRGEVVTDMEEPIFKPSIIHQVEPMGLKPIPVNMENYLQRIYGAKSQDQEMQLPALVIEVASDDFVTDCKAVDEDHGILVYDGKSWWVGYKKFDDLGKYVSGSSFKRYSIQFPDTMPLMKLREVIDAFDGHEMIELLTEKGEKLELVIDHHGCGVLPEIEPLLLTLKESGVTINKTDFVIYPALDQVIRTYQNLAEANDTKGVVEIYVGKLNHGVNFGQMMQLLAKLDFRFELYDDQEQMIILGNPSKNHIPMLPISPHSKDFRWSK